MNCYTVVCFLSRLNKLCIYGFSNQMFYINVKEDEKIHYFSRFQEYVTKKQN